MHIDTMETMEKKAKPDLKIVNATICIIMLFGPYQVPITTVLVSMAPTKRPQSWSSYRNRNTFISSGLANAMR